MAHELSQLSCACEAFGFYIGSHSIRIWIIGRQTKIGEPVLGDVKNDPERFLVGYFLPVLLYGGKI